jgi:hypothetical protein
MSLKVLVLMVVTVMLGPLNVTAQHVRSVGDSTYPQNIGLLSNAALVRVPGARPHGTSIEVTERYLGMCDGWIDYPCRKTRTVTKWQYQNLYVKVTKLFVYCWYEACQYSSQGGIKHEWSGGCLGAGTRRCYWSGRQDSKLSNKGSCNYVTDSELERC